MTNIIGEKFNKVELVRDITKSDQKRVIAESTYDDFWGSGLN